VVATSCPSTPEDSPADTFSATTFLNDLAVAVGALASLVRSSCPEQCSGDEARAVVALLSEAERVAASGVALFTPVVIKTGSYAKTGEGSAQDWFAKVAGTSAGQAKGRLAAAERAAVDPQLTEALHEGELSAEQLKVVARAAAEAPESTGPLLELLERGASHQELSDTVARQRAARRSRESERIRDDRVHAQRYFRWRQDPEGGIRGEFFCGEVQWARVGPLLEREAKGCWKASGDGSSSPYDAHRLDALIGLLGRSGRTSGSGGSGGSGSGDSSDTSGEGGPPDSGSPSGSGSGGSGFGARPHAVVIIDAAALRRGTTEGDEKCEIEGIGPVSVAAATELIGEGGLSYVVREGIDIRTVTKRTRVVAACIDIALLVRDRTCAVPGCGKRLGLERDHRLVDYGKGGPTALKNLVRLCPEHHDLKTHGGWRLEGEPGTFKWVAPAHPKSGQQIARARKLAAAKAAARAGPKQNNPRQT
jgi:hypothetical protein